MFLERSTLPSLAESKMVAEIVSVTHPDIAPLMRDYTYEDMKEVSDQDSIIGVRDFLVYHGVSNESINRFMRDYSERLMRMNANTLMYDYFQLEHMQNKVRQLARRNPSLKAYTKGRDLTDLEWSFVSAKLGEFLLNKPYPFRPEIVNIHSLYETALVFAMQDADLYNSDFAKRGLNQEIGDTTLTLLHNQRESLDLETMADDMPGFKRISSAIYKASKELWKHAKQGTSRDFVIYDLVSRLQDNTILNIRNIMSRELRRKTKGRTSLAPVIEFTKTHGITEGATSHTQKILDHKVSDRDFQLKPLDKLLTGIASSKDIYDARVQYFDLTNTVTTKDGRQIYRGLDLRDRRVDESLNIIVEGYAALKELLDFCRKTGYNFLRIPTYAFRDYSISRRYDSFKNYVEFVEVALKLEEESRISAELNLKSNEMVFGEDVLEIRNQLRTSAIGDVYQEEEFKDLTFLRLWITQGHYLVNSSNHTIFQTLLRYGCIMRDIWDKFKVNDKYVELENGYEYKFNFAQVPRTLYKSIWLKQFYKEKLDSTPEDKQWFHYNTYILKLSKSVLKDNSASEEACFFTYLRFINALEKLEGVLRPFITKLIEVEGDITKISNEAAIFRMFHESPQIIRMMHESVSYEGLTKIIKDLDLDYYYNTYTGTGAAETSLARIVSLYLKEYPKIIEYLRFVYRKYVVSVEESFTTMSKASFEVDENTLLDVSYKIYNLPMNEEAWENVGFESLLRNSVVDKNTGILMDKTGMRPITIKRETTRVTYVHENGYYLDVFSPTLILENPILKGESVIGS